jgi:hypothetical protein
MAQQKQYLCEMFYCLVEVAILLTLNTAEGAVYRPSTRPFCTGK